MSVPLREHLMKEILKPIELNAAWQCRHLPIAANKKDVRRYLSPPMRPAIPG